MKFRSLVLSATALILAGTIAYAGNTTLFSSSTGDLVFPFTPPTSAGAAGAIDNMIIGATTPRAGAFTTAKWSLPLVAQGAPAAKTVSATLTGAEVLTGIITVNQAAGAASALQLPLASAMDTALPDAVAGYAYDFSVINTSTVDAEDASITTNTGWTLVGSMDVHAYSAAGSLNSSGRFRARKTGTATWVLYRLS